MKSSSESKTSFRKTDFPLLDQVPAHWTIAKLRTLLQPVNNRGGNDLPLLSVTREKGVIKRNITSKDENHNYIPEDLSNYKVVGNGQFAVNKMKAWQGSYGVSKFNGLVSPAYFVFDLKGVNPDFFHHAIRSKAYVPFFWQASDGIRVDQWDLSTQRMKEIPFLIPPLEEQNAIVRYLNHMDNLIKRYIRAKQKEIRLLEEKKQAIIQQAVTRGLDPSIKLKPSGIKWLGEIPEHWKIKKLKYEMSFLGGGTPSKAESSYWNGDIPWVSPKDMKFEYIDDAEDHITERAIIESSTQLIPTGSVLMVVRSGILRRTIPIAFCNRDVAINQDMKAIITKGRILPEYFINFVRGCESDLLAQWSKQGATVESIEYQYLSNSLIPIPTIKEQQEIIQFVKDKTRNLSSNISIAYKVIRILQEYRNNIISHLVTGKINVFELSELLTKNNISGERFEEELTEYEFLGEDSSEEVEVE